MRYSLLSRFQGTLLAAVVAEALGSAWDGLALPSSRLNGTSPDVSGFDLNASTQQSLTQIYAENLIQYGDLNLEDLRCRASDAVPSALLPVQAIAAVLPVILFFHEDEAKLKQKVIEATRFWQSPLELQTSALAVAYAIAQALREQLQPSTLISQTIAYLPETASLVQMLQQVQQLLEQGAGLDNARTQLLLATTAKPIEVSVALAFYCFLHTLENFRLTVTLALRTAYESPLTAIVAAVLSGAYNSSIGIPLVWRLAFSQEPPSDAHLMPSAGRTEAEQLMAAWAGSYAPTKALRSSLALVPVAAPNLIRPR